MGSFVHAVLEDLFALPAEDRTMPMARKLMALQWDGEWKDKAYDVLGTNPDRIRAFRWNSWWCIENYFKLEDPASFEPDGIEHELYSPIEGVTIKGYIDRWNKQDDAIRITDYKTGKTPKPAYRDAKFFQLLVYGDILSAELEMPLGQVELLYLKDGVRLKLDAGDIMDTRIVQMRKTVAATREAILDRCETGHFEATKNKLCDWCSYKSFCPAWQK